MPKDLDITNGTRNTGLNAITVLLNSGKLRIYSGTKPATADTALSGNTLLAELTFGATAFAAAVAGVATANAITSDSAADATGTAAWFRTFQSNGSTTVYDGTVGTTAGQSDLVLNSAAITAGAEVAVTSLTLTLPAGV